MRVGTVRLWGGPGVPDKSLEEAETGEGYRSGIAKNAWRQDLIERGSGFQLRSGLLGMCWFLKLLCLQVECNSVFVAWLVFTFYVDTMPFFLAHWRLFSSALAFELSYFLAGL